MIRLFFKISELVPPIYWLKMRIMRFTVKH